MNRETLIKELRGDIAQGRVVTITGTGVSLSACKNQLVEGHAVASWPGLLRHGLEYCQILDVANEDEIRLVREQIKSNTVTLLIIAADFISRRLNAHSKGTFRGWLAHTLGVLEPRNPRVLHALSNLPGLLATLNYDNLIEKITHREAVTWLSKDKVQQVLLRNKNAILHLHGYFDEPESVVLGSTTYNQIVRDAHAKIVFQLLPVAHTLLFVGCGGTVKDPNFSSLIKWGKTALDDVIPRHVFLCRQSEFDTVRNELKSAPWLQPLIYGREFHELPAFLRGLAPQKDHRSPPKVANPIVVIGGARPPKRPIRPTISPIGVAAATFKQPGLIMNAIRDVVDIGESEITLNKEAEIDPDNLFVFPDAKLIKLSGVLNAQAFRSIRWRGTGRRLPENIEEKTQRNSSHFRKNPYTILLIRAFTFYGFVPLEEYIGFTHLIPLNDIGYAEYCNGKIEDNLLGENVISFPGQAPAAVLLFSVAADSRSLRRAYNGPSIRNSLSSWKYEIAARLVRAMAFHLCKLMEIQGKISSTKLLAQNDGEIGMSTFLELTRFVETGHLSKDGFPIQSVVCNRAPF